MGQQSVDWNSGHHDVTIAKFSAKLCGELFPVFALSPPSSSKCDPVIVPVFI